MAQEAVTTRFAQQSQATAIIDLSDCVQTAITASGNLQIIGPLKHETVITAIQEQRCFVLQSQPDDAVIGCAMVRSIPTDYYHPTPTFNLAEWRKPLQYVHSFMLATEWQRRGVGIGFFREVAKCLEGKGGTLILDCWAGSEKLRDFYVRCGCTYVATVPKGGFEVAVFVMMLSRTDEMQTI